MCIEDALRTLQDRLATIGLLANALSESVNEDHPKAFSGLADICEDLDDLLDRIHESLTVKALCLTLKRKRRAG